MKKLLLSLLLIPSLSYSDPYPTDYWAVRNGVSSVQISPEGSYISYLFIGSKYSEPVVHIKEADNFSKEPQVIGADKMEVISYSWVDDTGMVVDFRQQTRENIKGFNDGIYDYKSALLDVKKGKFTELENVDTPVSFIYGKETNLLPIVEEALQGKEKDSELSIEVSSELGFGEIDEGLIFQDTLENVPEEYRKVGIQIDFANDKGVKRKFRVTKIDDKKITFDGNHLFAGKELLYRIKIVEVADTEQIQIKNSSY